MGGDEELLYRTYKYDNNGDNKEDDVQQYEIQKYYEEKEEENKKEKRKRNKTFKGMHCCIQTVRMLCERTAAHIHHG